MENVLYHLAERGIKWEDMFCPNPWTRLEVKADGSVYCCCEGWLPRSLGNVLEDDLLSLWNGSVVHEIRGAILDGSFRYCVACPYLPGPQGSVVAARPNDITLACSLNRVGTLKLDYDQTCQLACRSCRTVHSDDFVNIAKVNKIHEAVLASGILDVTDQVYVTGAGDPFASPLYRKFLYDLPDLLTCRGDGPTVFLHTNGLLLDESHWEAMGRTKDRVVGVGISVDAATEATYKSNRGASWQKLWTNVRFLNRKQVEAARGGRQIVLGMFYTVQANNFRELIPFMKLAFDHNVSWLSVTALRNWDTYTNEEYRRRAVHLPSHPEHGEWMEIASDLQLTKDPRMILDSFNPDYGHQEAVCNPNAVLPVK